MVAVTSSITARFPAGGTPHAGLKLINTFHDGGSGSSRQAWKALRALRNQQRDPALAPHITTPRSQAARSVRSSPWARHAPSIESTLPDVLVSLMQDVGAPRGVSELGYGEDDVDAIVDGACKQQRLLVVAPTEVGPNELAGIVRDSMDNW